MSFPLESLTPDSKLCFWLASPLASPVFCSSQLKISWTDKYLAPSSSPVGGRPCFSARFISREFSKYREVRQLLGNHEEWQVSTFTAHTNFSRVDYTSHSVLPPTPFFYCSQLPWSPSFSKHGWQRSLVATLPQSNRHVPYWPLPPFWRDKAPSSVPPDSPSTAPVSSAFLDHPPLSKL